MVVVGGFLLSLPRRGWGHRTRPERSEGRCGFSPKGFLLFGEPKGRADPTFQQGRLGEDYAVRM